MAILKFHQTKIGPFVVESLGKVPPRRILSRKERLRMQKLHNEVQLWADRNLHEEPYQRFRSALDAKQYDTALGVLTDAFRANTCITLLWRRRWELWRANFNRGFEPDA